MSVDGEESSVEVTTALHPCSIETPPRLPGSRPCFACGLYELDEAAGHRRGRVLIVDDEGSSLAELDTSGGVLDMKWSSSQEGCRLAYVASGGELSILRYEDSQLEPSSGLSLSSEGMLLSLDWDGGKHSSSSSIAVSSQMGNVHIVDVREGLRETLCLRGHSIGGEEVPAWICAFDPHGRSTVLSGGDDHKLRLWDLRQGSSVLNASHQAGVTAAQWHPSREVLFATGSYDERLRIWDVRQLNTPLATASTGGGVWRVKWVLHDTISRLLCACMQFGVNCFEFSEVDPSSLRSVLTRKGKDPQRHLLYGVDVVADEGDTWTVASCSFYENCVDIWSCRLREVEEPTCYV